MKNLVLGFLIIFMMSQTIKSQDQYIGITGLNITQLSESQLKVNLKA